MKLSNLIEQLKKGFVKHNILKRAEKLIERIMNLLNQLAIEGDILINCSFLPKDFKAKVKRIKGDVIITGYPKSLLFLESLLRVDGDFDCSNMLLVTLKGFPKYVGGDLYIYCNNILDLTGLPKYIGRTLFIYGNKKKFKPELIRKISTIKDGIEV